MAPKRHGAIMALINEVRTGSTAYQLTWAYDEVGNRLTQTKNGVLTTYTCNDANQLVTEITGSTAITYQYDPNGNLTAKTDPTGTTTWLYDYENRQINYQDPLNSGSYVYDASGRRIGHTSIVTTLKSGGSQSAASKIGVGNGKGKGAQNGQGTQNAIANQYETITTTEKYIYDGANIIADYSLVSGIWNLASTYLTPFLDQNLLVSRGGNTYYFQADGLGSVRNLLDATQSVKNSYDYYAFGEALSQVEGVSNRYRFTSREWDGESSTYYYRARQYNPSVGRFTARDPIEYIAGLNLYSYVQNNPVNYMDPTGKYYGLDPNEFTIPPPEPEEPPHKLHCPSIGLGGTPAEAPKNYCCCVKSLDIVNIAPLPIEGIKFGHKFDLEMKLEYIEWDKDYFADCELEWWEKRVGVSPPRDYVAKGVKEGEWNDTFKILPNKFKWPKEGRNIKCPGKETFNEPDSPGLIATWDRPDTKRTLYFAIKVKNAPDCPCANTRPAVVFARQTLEINAGEPKRPGEFIPGGVSDWPPGF